MEFSWRQRNNVKHIIKTCKCDDIGIIRIRACGGGFPDLDGKDEKCQGLGDKAGCVDVGREDFSPGLLKL